LFAVKALRHDLLLQPQRKWSRQEVLATPSPVPRQSGIYAWYFREIPPHVSVENCHVHGADTLLYIGISPKEPSRNGFAPSKQTLFDRIRYHYRGNAEGSTLRLTLGCLLSEKLGIQLRRVGSGNRKTFADGEHILSQWLQDNAFVVWVVDPEPWVVEKRVIGEVSLPLNLDMNKKHPFHTVLSAIRKTAKQSAAILPKASEPWPKERLH
jgi:hypothetical protein